MDARSSFRLPGEKVFGLGLGASGSSSGGGGKSGPAMFKALRRLHGHNLENQGLNDLTEAFQSFVTRARFFSVGKLRRTWSHSAVEFMKYRRLLPMILADGQNFEGETDDFNAALAFQAASKDERKIIVTNVSSRVTPTQLQAFFTQFGKVSHCSLPREDGRKHSTGFATLHKHAKTCGVATITFKSAESAQKARDAPPELLKFYDQVMSVQAYVSRKRGKGMVMSDDSRDDDRLSMTSSTQSLCASSPGAEQQLLSPDDLPPAALGRVLAFLPIPDTVRLERVNKRWLEASMQSWQYINTLSLYRDADECFTKAHPLRNAHLRAILTRAGAHIHALDLSGVVHLLDSRSLEIISQHCKALKQLDLSGVRASADALQDLSEAMPSLQHISYRDMINVNDKSLWFLMKGCARSLRVVDLRGCRRMHGRCLRLYGAQLEQLYLDGCSRLDERALEDLCESATALKELRLNECFLVTDSNINMLARSLPDLQVLTLCGGRFARLTADGLQHVAQMRNIVELALDYNPLVTDALLEAITDSLHSLTSLSIANAGTDQSITVEGMQAVAKMKQLEQLDVSCLAAVKSAATQAFARNLDKLEVLQARNCVYLVDEGVKVLGALKKLRHLDLSGSMLVTSEAIQELINAYPAGEDGSVTVTVVVGGTAADAARLRVRGSRVAVNFSDFSTITGLASAGASGSMRRSAGDIFQPTTTVRGSMYVGSDEDDASDDEFESLTAQRSFYMDTVEGDDDASPLTEKEMIEWAEREARELGLLK